ncbi:hypothetical protein BDZ97DRAFT_1365576 [Flammula alnicola]|nr:hypothetical protein BDZ97DRAFT_1365576 [Flammula alnicola]
MVSNSGIPPLTEIFNTYGEELTNAELLNQYGFILDVNDNDRLSWTLDEIIHILSPGAYTENSLQSLVVDIRRVISCLPEGHSVFSDSQLIYHEASAEEKFCLSEEGTMSHQLWAVLFGLSFRRNLSRSPEIDISRTLHAVLDLQTRAENLDGNDEDDSDTDDRDDRYPTETLDQPDQMALKLLLDVCQLAVKLCTMRKANSGREEFGGMGLSDVMEEIPDSSIRTRLAISLLMGERSVLDCCEAAWMALLSSATRLLEGFAPAPLFGIS